MSDLATQGVRGRVLFVRRFEVEVVRGVDAGTRAVSGDHELSIGTAEGNELRLTDPTVSRHHCSLRTHERGFELRDHSSRNGTFVGSCELARGFVRSGARITLGHTELEVRILPEEIEQDMAEADRLGPLLGASAAMRRMFALVERCAASPATVLIFGETGTGKELVAEAIHDRSPRRAAPFVVVDCSALSPELAEAELFGHARGAFTGADTARTGAFESADGGTVFLDEIGELPLELQPLLLRVLENRTIRRVGESTHRPVDVRVIAASHRDLRALVNDRRFRADLFYRLHVVPIDVPPLREREDDVRMLASHFWAGFQHDRAPPPALLDQLAVRSWPGNVRELRNTVERVALLGWSPAAVPADDEMTYQQARDTLVWGWERGWIERLLARHGGNLTHAARASRMGRSHLRELIRRHGLANRDESDEE